MQDAENPTQRNEMTPSRPEGETPQDSPDGRRRFLKLSLLGTAAGMAYATPKFVEAAGSQGCLSPEPLQQFVGDGSIQSDCGVGQYTFIATGGIDLPCSIDCLEGTGEFLADYDHGEVFFTTTGPLTGTCDAGTFNLSGSGLYQDSFNSFPDSVQNVTLSASGTFVDGDVVSMTVTGTVPDADCAPDVPGEVLFTINLS